MSERTHGSTPAGPRVNLPADCAAKFAGLRLLGTGGFGAVYLARQVALDRMVAVKVLHGDVLEDAEQVGRFVNEARITASLAHPAIVRIFDQGAQTGVPWIAYEYIPGRSLRQIVESGGLPLAEAIRAAIAVTGAIEAAHARGILHRDIKPDNVLEAEDGHFKVTDFGLAKWAGAGAIKTATGIVLGTPAYMAPELIRGATAGVASDIYALGILLYELFVGDVPFADDNPTAVLDRHLRASVPLPGQARAGLPPELDAIVGRALAKAPGGRYHEASALRAALEGLPEDILLGIGPPGAGGERSADKRSADIGPQPTRALDRPRARPNGAAKGAAAVRTVMIAPTRAGPPAWRTAGRGILVACVLAAGTLWVWSVRHHTPASGPAAGFATAAGVTATPRIASGERADTADAAADAHNPQGASGEVAEPLSSGWSPFQSYESSLRGSGKAAASTMAWIRKRYTRVDFGPDPRVWATWISINRWLEDPAKPWSGMETPRLPPGMADFQLATDFEGLSVTLEPRMVVAAMSAMTHNPHDGRAWLLLGFLLERDGRGRDARVAYTTALGLLRGRPFVSPVVPVWSGLARALSLVPRHRLQAEFTSYIEPGPDQAPAWSGLFATAFFPGESRDGLQHLLEDAVHDDKLGLSASVQLGEFYQPPNAPWLRRPEKTLEIWTSALVRFPTGTPLLHRLIRFHLERGDIDAANVLLPRLDSTSVWNSIAAQIATTRVAPELTSPQLREDSTGTQLVRLIVFRHLEAGQVKEANREALSIPHDDPLGLDSPAIAMELSLAPNPAPWVEPYVVARLMDVPFMWHYWSSASGILTTPRGVESMERFLATARQKWPQAADLDALEALWLSRRGLPDQALDRLVALHGEYMVMRPPDALLAEVLGRPLWQQALGIAGVDRAAARARTLPMSASGDLAPRYWKAMVGGSFDEAARVARDLFEQDPREPIWSLVQVWNAVRRHDRKVFDEWVRRARYTYRFHRVGLWPLRELDAMQRRMDGR